ncbi:ABC transporter permease [Liquorilactobacillus sicerae]|uniref:ABC transporter permease n=1 Tax=Liquorilactobacillus sicerae TaxID=1416943 RepID=UPI0024808090|nr:ABC transporter permease [Liquorilactobacillus sicerae]
MSYSFFYLPHLYRSSFNLSTINSSNEYSIYNYSDFINIVIWDSFSLVLPAMIVIFSNYLINVEHISGALKDNITCAVAVNKLYASKLLVLCIINLVFAAIEDNLINSSSCKILFDKKELDNYTMLK